MPEEPINEPGSGPEPLTDEQVELINTRWRDAVPQELGTHASLADYKDLASVLSSHNNAQSMIGKKMDPFPKEDWDDEQVNEFYRKLGWTDDKSAFEYEGPDDAPEDMYSLQDDFDRFVDTVIKHRIPAKQAKALWKDLANQAADRYKGGKENYQNFINEGMEALKKEFGQTFDEKRQQVPATLKKAFGEDFVKYLTDSGLANHPQMLRAGMILTDVFKEDKANTPAEKNSMGNLRPAEAESMANKMLGDKKHPLNDRSHPEHDEAVEKYHKLMTVALGGKV